MYLDEIDKINLLDDLDEEFSPCPRCGGDSDLIEKELSGRLFVQSVCCDCRFTVSVEKRGSYLDCVDVLCSLWNLK